MTQEISHYRILGKLGAGGMGEVYLAEDTKLHRRVALKFLLPDAASDPRRMQRFLQEARAAASLHHENIAHIYEIGEDDGRAFIVMEYVEGQTLHARIDGRPLDTDELVRTAMQIAAALEEAHRAGITHRDIKPANILITARGQVKVLDFGLAKITAAEATGDPNEISTQIHTDAGAVMGTIHYMSPEQALGRAVDRRTDVFSLGVVLYEMATGRRPFAGATATATIDQILHATPDSLSRLNPGIPPELERVIRRCLEKDRSRRYSSAQELLDDLRTLQRGLDHPPTPSGPSVAPARARWSRSAALALIVLAVAAAGGWLAFRDKPIDSVAVLPFTNASANPDMDYLSDGITENLINRLSQLSGLRVVPRTTVYRYKGKESDPQKIGRALGVRAVIIGRVIPRGQTLSIRVELVDVVEVSQLWGGQYDRNVADLLTIEDEIAEEVVEKLRVDVDDIERSHLRKRYTESAEAHQRYLRGRYFWNKRTREGIAQGIQHFREAIDADPGYALAYAGLADCYNFLGAFGIAIVPPAETMPKAKAAANKALEIDESLAEAHASLAFAYLYYDWDWTGAERHFRRAIELSPNYAPAHQWYSHLLMARKRTGEAIAKAKRAAELDPLSLTAAMNLGWQYHWARQPEQAVATFRKILEMEPSFEQGHWGLGLAYEQEKKFDQAVAEFSRAAELSEGNPVYVAALGHAHAAAGRRDEAAKIAITLEERARTAYVPPYWMATLAVGLAQKDRAFFWLDQAHAERSGGMIWLAADPRMDPLRSDPRFDVLLRRVGL